MLTAEEIIERYQLEPLDQEGGYFRQVWRSGLRVENRELCDRYADEGSHPMGTLIYFLLTKESFSAMHRLPTVEHWFYHLGDPAEMLLLHENGNAETVTLGAGISVGERIHVATSIGAWQGTVLKEVEGGCGYFFGSCMMVPGFEWSDFELGERGKLCQKYPGFEKEIQMRTREHAVSGEL